MSKTLKSSLKTNIKVLVKKHSDNLNNEQFEQFKMSILGAIAIVLLKKHVIDRPLKDIDEFTKLYSEEIVFIDKHFEVIDYKINIDLLKNKDIMHIINIVIVALIDGTSIDDDLLSWMYQYFNIGNSFNYLSNTQFFTEKYMIEYLVDKNLISDSPNIKIIDPACGGGNFLIYSFDKVIKLLNVENGAITVQVIKTALNTIFGYDIDPNLAILAAIGLKIKALDLLNKDGKHTVEILEDIKTNIFISMYKNKVGALDVTSDNHVIINIEKSQKMNIKEFMADNEYDYVFTNPPFQGIKGMDKELRYYLQNNYPESKGDLCNAFIDKTLALLKPSGKSGLVVQTSWMFLDSYSHLREKVLKSYHIQNIVDLGSNAFADLSGEKANVALVTFINKKPKDNTMTSILRLKYYSKKEKPEVLIAKSYRESQVFELQQKCFLDNKGHTLEYLSFGKIKSSFNKLPPYREFAIPMQGTSTGDNNKFIDYHWNKDSSDWVFVSKGGGYCKWNGLNYYKILWKNDGENIKNHPGSALRNVKYFDRTDLVYSDTGTSGLSVRLLKENQIFIASGPGIRDLKGNKYAHLALLNSRLFSYFLRILTPKMTISAGYIANVPTVSALVFSTELSEIGKKCALLKDSVLRNIVINNEFQHKNYTNKTIVERVEDDIIDNLEFELERLKLEKRIENIVMHAYDFDTNEIEHIYEEVGYCAMDAVKAKELPDIKMIDAYYFNALTPTCDITIFKKNRYQMGVEGILEGLAIEYGYCPELIFSYVREHISELKLTKEVYFKDYIHKIILYLVGYKNPSMTTMTRIKLDYALQEMFYSYKTIDINYYSKVKSWIVRDFNEWHKVAFKNSPILQYDYKLDEIFIIES